MTDRDERRATAKRVFATIADEYVGREGITRGRMFASEGLKTNGKLFAFASEGLIVKLPPAHAAELVADGTAARVQQGRRTMREWVRVEVPSTVAALDLWRRLMADAHRYVTELASASADRSTDES